jgi:hypothetical protein
MLKMRSYGRLITITINAIPEVMTKITGSSWPCIPVQRELASRGCFLTGVMRQWALEILKACKGEFGRPVSREHRCTAKLKGGQ